MDIILTCRDATVQTVFEDRIDEQTGLVMLHPQTLRPLQMQLPDRHIVDLAGEEGGVSLTVRLTGALENAFQTGKRYAVHIEEVG